MATTDPTDDGTEPFTPERLNEIHQEYRERHPNEAADAAVLDLYITPASRARILRAFIGWQNEELAGSDIYGSGDEDGLADVGSTTFDRQIDALLELEVVKQTRTVGGAPLYQVNQRHPIVQALGMADNLAQYGRTSLLVDRQVLGEPGGTRDSRRTRRETR